MTKSEGMTNDKSKKPESIFSRTWNHLRQMLLKIKCSSFASSPKFILSQVASGDQWVSAIPISEFFRHLAFVIRISPLSFLRNRLVEIQQRPAHHRPGGDLVQVQLGGHVLDVRNRDRQSRGAALFKVFVLLAPEPEY